MSKHDFSTSAVENILSQLTSAENECGNVALSSQGIDLAALLSISSMSILENTMNAINALSESLREIFSSGRTTYESVVSEVSDDDVMSSTTDVENDLQQIGLALSTLVSVMSGADLNDCTFSDSMSAIRYQLDYKLEKTLTIEDYVIYNKETGEYKYDWDNLSLDLQKNNVSDTELLAILDTFIDEDGNIDTENLETYLKYLASNGCYKYSSVDYPESSEATELNVMAYELEEINNYYLAMINSSDIDDSYRKELIKKVSLNNIVIGASKTVKTTVTTISYTSSCELDEVYPDNVGTLFIDGNGNFCCTTKLQPEGDWYKTDMTIEECKELGIEYKIVGNIQTGGDIYMKGKNHIYKIDVDLEISETVLSYDDVSKYIITDGTSDGTACIVYDYTTGNDKLKTIVNDFEKEYVDRKDSININNMDSFREEETTVEEALTDQAKSKAKSIAKKYVIKYAKEIIPYADVVTEVVEDVKHVYEYYSGNESISENNERVIYMENTYKETSDYREYLDDAGDKITDNIDAAAVVVYFDGTHASVESLYN